MAGHSKWNNIKRRKQAVDQKRGKIFTKLGREISQAVKEGGPDPDMNASLAQAIAKAKAANMPNDNINRSIQKAAGGLDGEHFDAITYEGYGPGGVAVLVSCLTDNRNRTAAYVRHAFNKYGGNLGTDGSVSFLFNNRAVFVIERRDDLDEETMMMEALEAGAEDMETEDEAFIIYAAPDDFAKVEKSLSGHGHKFAQAEVQPIPDSYVTLSDEAQIESMTELIDHLEDGDDVQDVWHNWEEPEEN